MRINRPIIAIVGVAVALRIWGIGFGLPEAVQARPDERPIISKAVDFCGGDPNPHEFNYPSLLPYLLCGVYWCLAWSLGTDGGAGDAVSALYLAGSPLLHVSARLLVVAFAAGTVWMWCMVASRAFGRRVGLLSGGLLAIAYLHVRESHFGTTDVPMLFFVVATQWYALAVLERGRRRDYAWAGLMVGLGVAVKYTAAIACVSIVAAHFMRRGRRRELDKLAMALAVSLVAFLCVMPYALLDFGGFRRDVFYEVVVHGRQGHVVNPGLGWREHVRVSLRYGLGAPFCLAAVVGLACSMHGPCKRRGALLAVFPLACYAAVGPRLTVFVRYALPFVPFMACWAAQACLTVQRRLGTSWGLVLLLSVAAPTVVRSTKFDALLNRTDTRALAARWLETRLKPGEVVGWVGPAWSIPLLHTKSEGGGRERLMAKVARITDAGMLKRRPYRYVVVASHRALGHYCRTPLQVLKRLSERYRVAAWWDPYTAAHGRSVYDVQDAFFLPFARLDGVSRPGPALVICERQSRD